MTTRLVTTSRLWSLNLTKVEKIIQHLFSGKRLRFPVIAYIVNEVH